MIIDALPAIATLFPILLIPIESLRLSSYVVVLPCRTKLILGSIEARHKHDFKSDVMPESNLIQCSHSSQAGQRWSGDENGAAL